VDIHIISEETGWYYLHALDSTLLQRVDSSLRMSYLFLMKPSLKLMD